MSVEISEHYGIVIRKEALRTRAIDSSTMLNVMEVTEPADEDESLYSFGPHFGGEAADALVKRLQDLGFQYVTDFFVFEASCPEWADFSVALAGEDPQS